MRSTRVRYLLLIAVLSVLAACRSPQSDITVEASPSTEPTAARSPSNTPQPAATQFPANDSDDDRAESYVPEGQTVWQHEDKPYETSKTAACSGDDVYYNFYGRVAITPQGDSLRWQRTDGAILNLQQTSTNHYAGTLPDFLTGYDLQVAVSFSSSTSLVATYTLVSQATPDCQFTFRFRTEPAF